MDLSALLDSVKKSVEFRKEITVFGIVYNMGILTLEEEQKANLDSNLEDLEGIEYLNQMKINVLSYAIKGLNGEILAPIVEVTKEEDSLKQDRAQFIKSLLAQMPSGVINQLFEFYADIKEESDDKIDKQTKCEWFKTPKERQKELDNKAREFLERQNEEEDLNVNLKRIDESTDKKPDKTSE